MAFNSFFIVACVSETSLGLVQRVQNRAIVRFYRIDWEHPHNELFATSRVLFINQS